MSKINAQGPAITFCTDFELPASEGPIKICASDSSKGIISVFGSEVGIRTERSSIDIGKNIELTLHEPDSEDIDSEETGSIILNASDTYNTSDFKMKSKHLAIQFGDRVRGQTALLIVEPEQVIVSVGDYNPDNKLSSQIILKSDSITLKSKSIILDGETKIHAGETALAVDKKGIHGKKQETTIDLQSDGLCLKSAENALKVSTETLEAKSTDIKLSAEVGINMEGVSFTLSAKALGNLKTALNQLQN